MKYTKGTLGLLVAISIMGTGMNAFGFLGFGGTSWKEEVLLHDERAKGRAKGVEGQRGSVLHFSLIEHPKPKRANRWHGRYA